MAHAPRFTRRTALGAGAALALGAGPAASLEGGPDLERLRAAFLYAFPIFEFARTAWIQAAATPQRPEHRFNQVAHRKTLADHANRNVTTPNNDTVYSSARIDLSNGPALLEIPSLSDRYFSVAFLNAFTDNFAYIGTRATGGVGGRLLLAGPDWTGETPEDARILRAPTHDVWMLGRVLVAGPEDLPAANRAQEQIRILAAADPTLARLAPTSATEPANLLGVVNEMLGRSPLRDPVGARAQGFKDLGLRPGAGAAWDSLAPPLQQAWREASAAALAELAGGFALHGEVKHGWRYPPPGIGAPGARDDIRAAVALSGLAALEQIEAAYARAQNDAGGAALHGDHRYRLRIPAETPADGFWSLSMYQIEPDGRLFFTENPIRRFAIGDRTAGLTRRQDGSIDIALQAEQPGDPDVNWLPAPRGPFALVFRAYIPKVAFLRGDWRLAPVERV